MACQPRKRVRLRPAAAKTPSAPGPAASGAARPRDRPRLRCLRRPARPGGAAFFNRATASALPWSARS
eukprot:4906086-Pyramimonas_sp.AAC.1